MGRRGLFRGGGAAASSTRGAPQAKAPAAPRAKVPAAPQSLPISPRGSLAKSLVLETLASHEDHVDRLLECANMTIFVQNETPRDERWFETQVQELVAIANEGVDFPSAVGNLIMSLDQLVELSDEASLNSFFNTLMMLGKAVRQVCSLPEPMCSSATYIASNRTALRLRLTTAARLRETGPRDIMRFDKVGDRRFFYIQRFTEPEEVAQQPAPAPEPTTAPASFSPFSGRGERLPESEQKVERLPESERKVERLPESEQEVERLPSEAVVLATLGEEELKSKIEQLKGMLQAFAEGGQQLQSLQERGDRLAEEMQQRLALDSDTRSTATRSTCPPSPAATFPPCATPTGTCCGLM